MERKCGVCHDRPVRFRCIQCHKPVCDECAFKTEHGAFCGRDCAAAYRDFKRTQGSEAPRGRSRGMFITLIVLVILAAAVLVVAYKMGWVPGLPGS